MPKPAGPVARREDYRLEVIPFGPRTDTPRAREAKRLLAQQHYAKGGANTAVLLAGLVKADTDELVGVAHFMPTTPPAARYASRVCTNTSPKNVLALSRLVVDEGEPKNAATLLIGGALRLLKKDRRWRRWDTVVSYADEAQGHEGTIYKASNWTECGSSSPHQRWCDPKTGRLVARKATSDRTVAQMEALGYERCGRSRKKRFLYPLRGRCVCED